MITPVSRKRIWIISEVFYPEEISTGHIMTEISLALAEGAEVNVICGPASYEKGAVHKSSDNDLGDVRIHRINAFNFSKNNLLLRLFRLIGISLLMFLKGLRLIGKSDTVLMVTNPAPMIPLVATLRRIKGFSFVILVHDIFPENLVVGKMLRHSNVLYKALKWLYDKSYKAAGTLIVLGRDMQAVMQQKTGLPESSVRIITNWADPEVEAAEPGKNPLLLKEGLSDKIVILYAGNHGRLQNLPEFLELVRDVNNDLVHFVFAGNGAVKQQMINYAEQEGLQNVHFWGGFSRSEQSLYLNACHIGLVTLSDQLYGLGVPSKTYNILACSRPVLFIGNKTTEIAMAVSEHQCGFVFSHEEREELLGFLNNLDQQQIPVLRQMGSNGLGSVNRLYTKNAVLEQFRELLK